MQILTDKVTLFGPHDEATIKQITTTAADERVVRAAVCPDGHKGYAVPIGGVTGNLDINKLMAGLNTIFDLDLFLLFSIIDGCTPSKGRLMIKWLVTTVAGLFPCSTYVRLPDVLPGPNVIDGAW